jgi:uncharacterized protein
MDPTNNQNNDVFVERAIDFPELLEKKSYFLLGPRQTGKTSLIDRTVKGVKVYDLLDTSTFLVLSRNPSLR